MSSDYPAHSPRLAARFTALAGEGRAGLIPFIAAGDPDLGISQTILDGLPAAGADLVELGMPFSDPMADGPAIQAASLRALQAGITLEKTLAMVSRFRDRDSDTPLILMGYYNPVYAYGPERFAAAAAQAGADGLIIVDLPPEEAHELQPQASAAGLDFVRLTTPTSDEARLPAILSDASGFIYHVSVRGVTGTRTAAQSDIEADIARLRRGTKLPLAVGFGIATPQQAAAVARAADAAVVGSALVQRIAASPPEQAADQALSFVNDLARAVRSARRDGAAA